MNAQQLAEQFVKEYPMTALVGDQADVKFLHKGKRISKLDVDGMIRAFVDSRRQSELEDEVRAAVHNSLKEDRIVKP